MSILICPGIHSPQLTESFLRGLGLQSSNILVFPAEEYAAYAAPEILAFLEKNLGKPSKTLSSVLFISFSAGVVGAIAAAWGWQIQGGQVKALLALDGWGVALGGNFPVHRLSHDAFTHWSSALLGAGEDSFYSFPPVSHLDLWRSPHQTQGWWLSDSGCGSRTSAAEFILILLKRYGEVVG